ncbi:hypothetical protein AGABI2DRAFT_225041 [Agaricus bisporus var. bisporus H97]|uniref:hypothetical protein n=1 Tax=Agaricus bisporus var. bisporus (strain H97 / ATCC MYA-4626 / FGSC 10389) TaxID=936046 RepID=UPI00029F5E5A|nr:hypothetical protein AGABI2DRAFT_225041 [Agaricus bisporus var. bisporus H97]EKV45191.1 hypothetical protein AGABI2DRAFT_225041 [Agaricus bisporus var. bisporus H97]
MWYHYGCVGISMGDDRLKDDVDYICPPCLATGTVAGSRGTGDSQKNKSRSASSTTEVCARPDCTYKKSSSDEFWVKRIVGRKTKVEGGSGRVEVYLVEWEGYPLGEATWQEDDTMGNPAELIADFVRATRKEGIDLDRDPNRTVLLKDAQRAGWTMDD